MKNIKVTRAARWCSVLILSTVVIPAEATVLYEDYRGLDNVPAALVPPTAPSYTNFPNGPGLTNLIALAADATNALETGTDLTVDWPTTSNTLCNNGTPTSAACVAGIQGRVVFARLKLPQAGTYTFQAAHDDQVEVDFSSQDTTAYRSANYDIPVGQLAAYTNGNNSFETLGNYAAGQANACVLMRIFWNNQDGVNLLRLQWTRPDNTTEIIPDGDLLDPTASSASGGCANGAAAANISLVKVLGAPRADNTDQFTLAIGNPAPIVTTTTTGSGVTLDNANASAVSIAPDVAYTLSEMMASGSASTLAAYNTTYACSNSAAGSATVLPNGSGSSFTVTPAAGDNISCSLTNTPTTATPIAPTLTVAKTIAGRAVATDEFTVAISNGGPSATTAGGTTASTAAYTATAGTTYTLSETGAGTPAADLADYNTTYSCANSNAGGTHISSGTGKMISITPVAGDAITCTFVNTPSPLLSLAKSHSGNFAVGETGSYTLLVSNVGYATTSGMITVTDTLPPGLAYQSAGGTGWTCTATGQVVSCLSTASIASGANGNPITVTVNVSAGSLPAVTNTATVRGGNDSTCAPAAPAARCAASDATTTPVRLQAFSVE